MIPIRNAVPSRYPPVVTWMLIAINCLMFLFQDSLGPDELELFLRHFALIRARYSEAFASGDADLEDMRFGYERRLCAVGGRSTTAHCGSGSCG